MSLRTQKNFVVSPEKKNIHEENLEHNYAPCYASLQNITDFMRDTAVDLMGLIRAPRIDCVKLEYLVCSKL